MLANVLTGHMTVLANRAPATAKQKDRWRPDIAYPNIAGRMTEVVVDWLQQKAGTVYGAPSDGSRGRLEGDLLMNTPLTNELLYKSVFYLCEVANICTPPHRYSIHFPIVARSWARVFIDYVLPLPTPSAPPPPLARFEMPWSDLNG
jgi:hypothetical protein